MILIVELIQCETHAKMLGSTLMGGNPLGCIESRDESRLYEVLQCFWMLFWISGEEGFGPHSTHRVTPLINSQVTKRKGTLTIQIKSVNEP